MNWKVRGGKRSWTKLNYYPGSYFQGLRQIKRILSVFKPRFKLGTSRTRSRSATCPTVAFGFALCSASLSQYVMNKVLVLGGVMNEKVDHGLLHKQESAPCQHREER
jgi:hypothetical protein